MTKEYMWVRYIMLGIFLTLIGVHALFGNEDTGAWVIAGIVLAGFAVFLFLNLRKKKKPSGGNNLKMASSIDGSRIRSLFSEWQGWVEVASVLGIVGFLGVTLFKVALLKALILMILAFVGFGILEYARIQRA